MTIKELSSITDNKRKTLIVTTDQLDPSILTKNHFVACLMLETRDYVAVNASSIRPEDIGPEMLDFQDLKCWDKQQCWKNQSSIRRIWNLKKLLQLNDCIASNKIQSCSDKKRYVM